MVDGSLLKTLVITDVPENVDIGVTSVAISSDDRLVAVGSLDAVSFVLVFFLTRPHLLLGRQDLGYSYWRIIGDITRTQRQRLQRCFHS